MWRVTLGLIIAGGFVSFFGYEEFKVGSGASAEPVQCELRSLEKGDYPPDKHLQLGPHWAIYPVWVGWGEEESDKLDYIYYPIVSEEHPYNQAWDDLIARYGDAEPPQSEWPELGSLGVLVKTDAFKSSRAIPDEWGDEVRLTGLVINDIEKLKADEKRLLNEHFPDLYLDDVWILEAGRKPKPVFGALGIMLGGVSLMGLGVVVFVKQR